MNFKDEKHRNIESKLPEDAKMVATLRANGKHESTSALSKAIQWGGFLGSVFTGVLASNYVEDKYAESPSNWRRIGPNAGAGESFLKSIAKIVDVKHWRSTLTTIAVIVPGTTMADFFAKIAEQKAFQQRYGDHPAFQPEALSKFKKTAEVQTEGRGVEEKNHEDTDKKHTVSERKHEGKVADTHTKEHETEMAM